VAFCPGAVKDRVLPLRRFPFPRVRVWFRVRVRVRVTLPSSEVGNGEVVCHRKRHVLVRMHVV